jgi:ribosomal protein S12 methylthiotransferase
VQKISIISLGCPKNTVESEYLLGIFKNKGFAISSNIEDSDIAVIHTCSFIKTAREESEKCIRSVLKLKRKFNLKVYVSGCFVQMLKKQFSKLFPEVDGFVGTGDLQNLPDLIVNSNLLDIAPAFNSGGLNASKYRLLSSGLPSAYLKIAEGCSHRCSFCIIPKLRGKYESRPIKTLVDEAKSLVCSGIQEIILIAQDTTSFGRDIYGNFVLDKLLSQLAKINGLKWIRLLYAYPSSITDNLLDVIKEYENICNYIDVPIQHISKNILAAMRRSLNAAKIIEKIKNKLPEIILRTSLISGFPGETEENTNELITFLKSGYFQYVGVFEYSNQSGQTSSNLSGHIAPIVAKERRVLIEKTQQDVFKSKFSKMINSEVEFLAESCVKQNNRYVIKGRSYFQAPEIDGSIILKSNKSLNIGKFYKANIKNIFGYDIKVEMK